MIILSPLLSVHIRRAFVFKDAIGIHAIWEVRGLCSSRPFRCHRTATSRKLHGWNGCHCGLVPLRVRCAWYPGIFCQWRFHCEGGHWRYLLCWPFECSFAQQDCANVWFSEKKVVDFFFFFVRCNPEDSYTMWTPCFSCEGLDITAASWKPPHREGGTLNHPWEVQTKPETQQTHDTHAGSTVTLLWSASSKTGINLKPQRAEDKIAK